MNVAAFIPLVGCIWNFLLACFVFAWAPRATQNRVYFCLGVCISIWNLGQFFNVLAPAGTGDFAPSGSASSGSA